MPFMKGEDVYNAIRNAPPGVQPEDVINGLVSRGFDLEGFPTSVASIGAQNGYRFSKIAEQEGSNPETAAGGIEESPVGKGINALASGMAVPAMAETGLNVAGGLTKAAVNLPSTISNAVQGAKSLPTTAGDVISLVADKANKVADMVGGFDSDSSVGEQIQNVVNQTSQAAKTKASQLYNDLNNNIPDIKIIPHNTINELGNQTLDLSQLPPTFQTGKLASFVKSSQDDLSGGVQSTKSLQELMALRQELSSLASKGSGIQGLAGQTSPMAQQAYSLAGAVDKDIQSAALEKGAEGFSDQLDAARSSWKQFKDTYSNPLIEKIASAKPSDVTGIATQSPESIDALQNASGPAATDLLRKGLTQQIMSKLDGGTTSPQTLLEKILSSKPEEMGKLYTSDNVDALRDYASAKQYMLSRPSEVPENTSTLQNLLPTAANGLVKMAGLGAAYELGKKVVSK